MKKIINEKFGLSSGDRVVLKVGSNILAGSDDGVNLLNMKNVVNSLDYLMGTGLNVVLVSSGAVAVGKGIMESQGKMYEENIGLIEKSYLSTVGQAKLINMYYKLFIEKDIIISQGLLTHSNIGGKHLKSTLEQNFKNCTLAILNENDFISGEELEGFSDNDELAGLVAEEINAKILFLLSDIDGLKKNYGKKNEELIKEVGNVSKARKYSVKVEGGVGKGQMDSKLNVMEKVTKLGITGILTNGGEIDIVKKILEGSESKKTIFRV